MMGNALIATQLLISLLGQAQGLSISLRRAHEEGRDLTDEELDSFAIGDDLARASLQRAIDARKGVQP